jgi:hypothetical protein
MRILAWALVASFCLVGAAQAGSREIAYGPAPAWVTASPAPTDAPDPAGAPARFVYADWQVHLGPKGREAYTAYRMKLLTAQGLAAGAISSTWDPASDEVTIHRLNIIRGEQVIDVLKIGKFQIIQRENNLEHSMLDGQLTATLQAPGLRVGDEIEFAMTVRRSDPTFGNRAGDVIQLPLLTAPGAFRARLLWPKTDAVQLRAADGSPEPVVRTLGAEVEHVFELRDPDSVVLTENAPTRYNIRRLVQYSSYASWAEVSNMIAPLFDKASTLAPGSAVAAEAARIAASTSDPVARTEAALALVQEQVRYVYVGLDGGNYRPATAEETWERRFGDCKAKTALLLALLRELGVPAEATLVSSTGGDGIETLLPSPQLFDHVLVRATIGGKLYWLDGTRPGDARLSHIPPPPFTWVLPLRPGAVTLEKVPFEAPREPSLDEILRVDASAGFDKKATFDIRRTVRGDEAMLFAKRIAILAPQDATRALSAMWRSEYNSVEPRTVDWKYDDVANVLVFTMTGEGLVDWEGSDRTGQVLSIYNSGFYPPTDLRRPAEQDQTAPALVEEFPSYKCYTTLVKLPPKTDRFDWDYQARPMDQRIGGTHYWRLVGLRDGVMRVTRASRVYQPELSAEEVKAAADAIPTFDNKVPRVFQRAPTRDRRGFAAPGAQAGWDADYTCAIPDR